MRTPGRLGSGMFLAGLLACTTLLVRPAAARSSFFSSRCSSCHTDDTSTCNGCHHHQGGLTASCDRASYRPGEAIQVTLSGGTQRGWIRALLYDQSNKQLDRKSGPTSSGDDGLASSVTFPVVLQGVAPSQPGDYTWQAAWFGNTGDGGTAHGETRTSVLIHVAEAPAAVEQLGWDRIKSLYR